jgi:hypothetical protein
MGGRPGFFGGPREGDAQERDVDSGFGADSPIGGPPRIRLGDPNAPRSADGFDTPPGFDPIWGTLGAPAAPSTDDWLTRDQGGAEGYSAEVEIFGNGFQISGEISTGQFERISDWLNMQTGFIQVRDAWHVHLGQTEAPAPDQRRNTLWVRLNQVVLVAERAPVQGGRPGAPVIQKQQRTVSVVTPGYRIVGKMHIVTYGSMAQFLETPDPHFLPITDVTVHWLSDPAMVGRYPFAMINRDQLVTLIDELASPGGDAAEAGPESEDELPDRRFGAA